MEWFATIGLVVLGIALIIIEIIFVPGTTIVGIIGLGFFIGGIYLGFDYFDNNIGWIILLGSSVLAAVSLVIAFKSNAWDRFSLKLTSSGKVNEGSMLSIKVGDTGVAVSTLKPYGKAEIGDVEYEVRSDGNYINAGEKIKVVRIDGINIYVELNNKE